MQCGSVAAMKEAERQRVILRKLSGMGGAPSRGSAIPTGFGAFDEACGGGLPRGHMVELFGPAGCGKTTLAIQIAAHLERQGLMPAWIDVDHTFDPGWAARLGLDAARMPVAQPESAEQSLEMARRLAASSAVDLLVLDSAAAMLPRLEMSLEIGSAPGLHSRVMASGLRKLSATLVRSGVCALFLNQMRNKLEASAGKGETSAGGPPLKLFASVRLMMAPAGSGRVALRIVKNSIAQSAATRDLEWRHDAGFAGSP
jgi:recombination protein RecA